MIDTTSKQVSYDWKKEGKNHFIKSIARGILILEIEKVKETWSCWVRGENFWLAYEPYDTKEEAQAQAESLAFDLLKIGLEDLAKTQRLQTPITE